MLDQRRVEPHLLPEQRELLRRRLIPERDLSRIARQDAQGDEDQNKHQQNGRYRIQQPLGNEPEHQADTVQTNLAVFRRQ